MNILPKPAALVREVVLVVAGGLITAMLLRQFPKLKQIIDGDKGCGCGG